MADRAGRGAGAAPDRRRAGLGARPGPGLPEDHADILILFGALPPAVINYVFAERYGREPRRVASIVLLGNAAAALTLPSALLLVL